jgi:hypothetical protein
MTFAFAPILRRAALAAMLVSATASVAAATAVGDCNDDMEVDIVELQRCVNIFLGDAALELCPLCSINGDDVGIVDLQGSVNCFLDSTAANCPAVAGGGGPTATPTPAAPTNTPAPTDTPPPTLTATSTPTATATPVCGDGLLVGSETCASCAADCTVSACTAVATPPRSFRVDYAAPAGQPVSAIKVQLAYRSNRLSLPGTGPTPGPRVKNRPSNTTTIVNDLNYAVEVTMSRSAGLVQGRLFTVDFDGCSGAAVPTVADLSCSVLDCGSSFGKVDGCSCTVTTP